MWKQHLHTQLSDRDARILSLTPIPILPNSALKLRTLNRDLTDSHACFCVYRFNHGVNPRIQSKDETGIVSVEYQISAREQYLCRT